MPQHKNITAHFPQHTVCTVSFSIAYPHRINQPGLIIPLLSISTQSCPRILSRRFRMLFRLHSYDNAASVTVIFSKKRIWSSRASCSGKPRFHGVFPCRPILMHFPPAYFPSTHRGWLDGYFHPVFQGSKHHVPVLSPSATSPCALPGAISGRLPLSLPRMSRCPPAACIFPVWKASFHAF